MRQLEAENHPAASDEQEILSRYVGWGGLSQAFDPQNADWKKEYEELKDLLSESEYASARASTLNAHYTSPTVIRAMYEAIGRMGFASGNILEKTLSTLIQRPVSFESGLNWFQPNKAFESGFTFAQ